MEQNRIKQSRIQYTTVENRIEQNRKNTIKVKNSRVN